MIAKTKGKQAAVTGAAVAYVRMSTDLQEASPERQREVIARLAKRNGLEIAREYFDDGVSGRDARKRDAFRQMIDDADKGQFKYILALDVARFGRFDSIDCGPWVGRLRDAGVVLWTDLEGRFDWNSQMGRIVYMLQQDSANQYSETLLNNTVGGKVKAAKRGVQFFKPSYALDRLIYDEKDVFIKRVRYNETFQRPTKWRCEVVPSEDTAAVETVKWMYREFDTTDCSLSSIAAKLNQQGVPSATGTLWTWSAVRFVLRNRAYLGELLFGKIREGKYQTVADHLEEDEAQVIVVKGHHEALIDEATFDRVQAKIRERHIEKRKPRKLGSLLTRLLYCGHCGLPMRSQRQNKQDRQYYLCSGAQKGVCACRHVRADWIEPKMAAFVESLYSSEKVREALAAAVTRKIKSRKADTGQPSPEALAKQVEKLDQQIKVGVRNLLEADPEDVATAKEIIDGWRQQRATVLEALEATRNARPKADEDLTPAERVERTVARLKQLRELIRSADTAIAREAFRKVFDRITLYWHPKVNKHNKVARIVVETHISSNLISNGLWSAAGNVTTITVSDEGTRTWKIDEVVAAVRALQNGHPLMPKEVGDYLGISRHAAGERLRRAALAGGVVRLKTKGWLLATGARDGRRQVDDI